MSDVILDYCRELDKLIIPQKRGNGKLNCQHQDAINLCTGDSQVTENLNERNSRPVI